MDNFAVRGSRFAARGSRLPPSRSALRWASGGPAGAHSGKMAIWVGGDEQVFQRYRPVLDAAGDQVSYIGPIGAASVVGSSVASP